MQVTRDNYQDLFPEIKAAIQASGFVAFDTEMTGLYYPDDHDGLCMADEEGHYRSASTSASRFMTPEWGLACFIPQEEGGWECRSFNFLIFPRSFENSRTPENESFFHVQASCLEFLHKHKFDFNEWVEKGLGTARESQLREMRSSITRFEGRLKRDEQLVAEGKERQVVWWGDESQPMKSLNGADQDTVDSTMEKIADWISEGAAAPLQLPFLNSFLRFCVHQTIRRRYGDVRKGGRYVLMEYDSDSGDGRGSLEVRYETAKEYLQRQHATLAMMRKKKWMMRGMRHVLEVIAEQRIPVVAHNCLLDLALTLRQFKGLDITRENCSKVFQNIVDTKYLWSHHPELTRMTTRTSVAALYDIALNTIGVSVDAGAVTEQEHHAAYDAFMTGVVYAGALKHTGEHGMKLDDFHNRIFLFQSPIRYLELQPSDTRHQPRVDYTRFVVVEHPKVRRNAIEKILYRNDVKPEVFPLTRDSCAISCANGTPASKVLSLLTRESGAMGFNARLWTAPDATPAPPAPAGGGGAHLLPVLVLLLAIVLLQMRNFAADGR